MCITHINIMCTIIDVVIIIISSSSSIIKAACHHPRRGRVLAGAPARRGPAGPPPRGGGRPRAAGAHAGLRSRPRRPGLVVLCCVALGCLSVCSAASIGNTGHIRCVLCSNKVICHTYMMSAMSQVRHVNKLRINKRTPKSRIALYATVPLYRVVLLRVSIVVSHGTVSIYITFLFSGARGGARTHRALSERRARLQDRHRADGH